MKKALFTFLGILAIITLSNCGGSMGAGSMGGPTSDARAESIAQEPTGNFYYGRRYYVHKTRFWGYIRQPRQSASKSKLVVFREDMKHAPDRLPEDGPQGASYGYDSNYEYKIFGNFTGRNVYDVNSDQILPEFLLTGYELVNKSPGWLFKPNDNYNPTRITLVPR